MLRPSAVTRQPQQHRSRENNRQWPVDLRCASQQRHHAGCQKPANGAEPASAAVNEGDRSVVGVLSRTPCRATVERQPAQHDAHQQDQRCALPVRDREPESARISPSR